MGWEGGGRAVGCGGREVESSRVGWEGAGRAVGWEGRGGEQ